MTSILKPGALDLVRLGIALGWSGIDVAQAREISVTPTEIHLPSDRGLLVTAAEELASAWCDEPTTGRLASYLALAVRVRFDDGSGR